MATKKKPVKKAAAKKPVAKAAAKKPAPKAAAKAVAPARSAARNQSNMVEKAMKYAEKNPAVALVGVIAVALAIMLLFTYRP